MDFDLRKTVEDSALLFSLQAHEKNLSFICHIESDTPCFLTGDPGRLRQVLINLCGNAIKFTEHGEIRIDVNTEKETETHAVIRFSVSDTGIGIHKELLDQLFKPFSQLDQSKTRKYGGTGLGLSISKRIVELMGGEIGVQSEPGKGSTFWFTAAFEKQKEKNHAEGTVREPLSARGGVPCSGRRRNARILLAEDNVINQKVISRMLTRAGYSVDCVYSGEEVIRALELAEYDLILMDVQMPYMDGIEATVAIRRHETGEHPIPIIAMTAHTMEGDKERCLASGMTDYIPKPVEPDSLYTAIERVLDREKT